MDDIWSPILFHIFSYLMYFENYYESWKYKLVCKSWKKSIDFGESKGYRNMLDRIVSHGMIRVSNNIWPSEIGEYLGKIYKTPIYCYVTKNDAFIFEKLKQIKKTFDDNYESKKRMLDYRKK